MSEKIEPPWSGPKIPSIVTIVLSAIALFLHWLEYYIAPYTIDAEYRVVSVIIITWGIVFPAIVITLCIIGVRIYEQSEYITLAFGIAITAISSILTFIAAYWTVTNTIQLVESISIYPELIPVFAGQVALVAVILAMQNEKAN
jgi:hypothetical protein